MDEFPRRTISDPESVPETWHAITFGRVPEAIAGALDGQNVGEGVLKDDGPTENGAFHKMSLIKTAQGDGSIGKTRATVRTFLNEGSTVELHL